MHTYKFLLIIALGALAGAIASNYKINDTFTVCKDATKNLIRSTVRNQ